MAKTSGSFSGGFDSRRYVSNGNGITEYREELAKKLSKHSLEAANIMVKAMKGDPKVTKLMLVAAQDICNRTGGNPVSQLHIAILDNKDEQDPTTIPTAELDKLVKRLSFEQGAIVEGEVVEIEAPTYSDNDAKNSLKESGIDV